MAESGLGAEYEAAKAKCPDLSGDNSGPFGSWNEYLGPYFQIMKGDCNLENDGFPPGYQGKKGITLYAEWMKCKGMNNQQAAAAFVEAVNSLEEREMLVNEEEEEDEDEDMGDLFG